MVDFARMQALAKRLIEANGRSVTLRRMERTPTDAAKPWRGSAARAVPEDTATVIGVFLDTISSRYLGLTIQRDGEEQGEQQLFLVATTSAPTKVLSSFDELLDGTQLWNIKALNVLRPGDDEIFVAFKATKRELFE
jgi:hypothetical protein